MTIGLRNLLDSLIIAVLIWYLTESKDRWTEDDAAPWTYWIADRLSDPAREVMFDRLDGMGLLGKWERAVDWHYVYRRACGRPVPRLWGDRYFGYRPMHPEETRP